MNVKSAAKDVLSAVNVLRHARDASLELRPLSYPMTDEELQARALLTARVIETRAKLEHLRNRAVDLQQSLERFKARRAVLAAA